MWKAIISGQPLKWLMRTYNYIYLLLNKKYTLYSLKNYYLNLLSTTKEENINTASTSICDKLFDKAHLNAISLTNCLLISQKRAYTLNNPFYFNFIRAAYLIVKVSE